MPFCKQCSRRCKLQYCWTCYRLHREQQPKNLHKQEPKAADQTARSSFKKLSWADITAQGDETDDSSSSDEETKNVVTRRATSPPPAHKTTMNQNTKAKPSRCCRTCGPACEAESCCEVCPILASCKRLCKTCNSRCVRIHCYLCRQQYQTQVEDGPDTNHNGGDGGGTDESSSVAIESSENSPTDSKHSRPVLSPQRPQRRSSFVPRSKEDPGNSSSSSCSSSSANSDGSSSNSNGNEKDNVPSSETKQEEDNGETNNHGGELGPRKKFIANLKPQQNRVCGNCKIPCNRAFCSDCRQEFAGQKADRIEIALKNEAAQPDHKCESKDCDNFVPFGIAFCAICRAEYQNTSRECRRCGALCTNNIYCTNCVEQIRREGPKICQDCGINRPKFGLNYCSECIRVFTQKQREQGEGRCNTCGAVVLGGQKYCRACVNAYKQKKETSS